MINRALGYEKLGGDPFQDVPDSAWYAEDVDIAYTEGYISGTSKTTFSPRQQHYPGGDGHYPHPKSDAAAGYRREHQLYRQPGAE